MSDEARRRKLDHAVERALAEQAGASRYERYQKEVRSGMSRVADQARPQEFDANGFPVVQRSGTFIERIARLLNPL